LADSLEKESAVRKGRGESREGDGLQANCRQEMAVTRSAYLLCITLRIRHDCSKGIM